MDFVVGKYKGSKEADGAAAGVVGFGV